MQKAPAAIADHVLAAVPEGEVGVFGRSDPLEAVRQRGQEGIEFDIVPAEQAERLGAVAPLDRAELAIVAEALEAEQKIADRFVLDARDLGRLEAARDLRRIPRDLTVGLRHCGGVRRVTEILGPRPIVGGSGCDTLSRTRRLPANPRERR